MGGIVSLWLLPLGTPYWSVALAIVFASIGSLLPDLDARESKLSNVQVGGITPLKPAAYALNRRLGHRGPMHSLLGLFFVAVIFGIPLGLFLDPLAGIGLVLGYLSHLLLDACTKSGIPLYWPKPGKIHLLPSGFRVVTGSWQEDLVFLLLTFAATGFLLGQLFTSSNRISNDSTTSPFITQYQSTIHQSS